MRYVRMRCLLFQYYMIILMCISSTYLLVELVRENPEFNIVSTVYRATDEGSHYSDAVREFYPVDDVLRAAKWIPTYSRNITSWVRPSSDIIRLVITEPVIDALGAKKCYGDASFTLLIAVVSTVANSKHRDAIRRTWASPDWTRSNVEVVFFVGQPSNRPDNMKLIRESTSHMDIVQGEFDDRYNGTFKTILTLHWSVTYCKTARYVLRVTDHMFVHVPNILSLIESHSLVNDMFVGTRQDLVEPVRKADKIGHVPRNVYPYMVYPIHADNGVWLASRSVVDKLLDSCSRLDAFVIDEVHVSGICRIQAGIIVHNHDYFVKRASQTTCEIFTMCVMKNMKFPTTMTAVLEKVNRFWNNNELLMSFCGHSNLHKTFPKRLPS